MSYEISKITVLMPVYNGEKYLREAIDSILSQTFTDFEFIIVNDISTDSTKEIISSYNDPRIRLINTDHNMGLVRSLNYGLKLAKGKYIARMDADDISLPNRLELQATYLDNYPEVALLGTGKYIINQNGKILSKTIALSDPCKNILKSNTFTHGSVMFKKNISEELGYYNELFKYSEDYELWLRFAKYYKVSNLPQPLYKWRVHTENITNTKVEEVMLYTFLAQKLTKNELDMVVLGKIKNKGIFELYSHLNTKEKTIFHVAVGHKYVKSNNLHQARDEYKKVFRMDPFNMKNNLHILMSFFGCNYINKLHELYDFRLRT